ncbi:unnamed protein product [Choristocarpus tenellus]
MFRRGSSSAVLKVEIYLDLTCSDCQEIWPTMMEVVGEYGDRVEFLFRLFPLPYHQNAFIAAQAAQVVYAHSCSDEEVESFVQLVFDHQEDVLNDATVGLTPPEIEALFAPWAMSATVGMTSDEYLRGMADSTLNLKARNEFKYACLHQVYGTPTVLLGGVRVETLESSNASQQVWKSILDELLKPEGRQWEEGGWIWP